MPFGWKIEQAQLPVVETMLGVGFGVGAHFVYESGVKGKTVAYGVQHYNWGLLSWIVASRVPALKYYGLGFGAALISEEAGQMDPFGLHDAEPALTVNFALTMILSGALLVSAMT